MAGSSSSSSPFFRRSEGDSMNQQGFTTQQPQPPPLQQHQHSLAVPPPSSSSTPPPPKKKRNLPDPDAEVIALSPKTLMATNRFICEVCNKGFQREQNLQLHRRGHNLPWKLKQKNNKEPVRKKVYLCPEISCVHHDPARALGDLTGIKKHFSRKHGEKKFKCDKCSKRYAVQSDWKAHSKTCGTREYRCDCGTLFSRRDSFITHRAFCDALAQESARHPSNLTTLGTHLFGSPATNPMGLGVGLTNHLPSLSDQNTADIFGLNGSNPSRPTHFDHLLGTNSSPFRPPSSTNYYLPDPHHSTSGGSTLSGGGGGGRGGGGFSGSNNHQHHLHDNQAQGNAGMFSNKLFPGQLNQLPDLQGNSAPFNPGFFSSDDIANTTPNSSSFFGGGSTLYATTGPVLQPGGGGPHMSATALLQKAAQMGSTTSTGNASATALLKGFPSSVGPKPPSVTPPSSIPNFGGIFGEQNDQNNLQDLIMNSLEGADTSRSWGPPLEHNNNNPSGQQAQGVGSRSVLLDPNKSILGGIRSSDGMTRDFLGVGEIVRSMSGGFAGQRDHHQQQQEGVNNTQAATTSISQKGFGGGNFH